MTEEAAGDERSRVPLGPHGRRWREGLGRVLHRPPRLTFHVAAGLATLLVLWAFSVPGLNFFMAWPSILFLVGLALVWLIRGASYLRACLLGCGVGSWRWLVVAPIGGLMTVALLWSDVPLRIRWAASRAEFEAMLKRAPAPTSKTEWITFEVPEDLGAYRINEASRVGDGLIFYESTGALFDYAGFAYLPTGPFDELNTGWFEAPQFRPLGGSWYAWVASW